MMTDSPLDREMHDSRLQGTTDDRPVFGLPMSLMRWEGKIPKAVVMIHKALGLNRHNRRKLESSYKKKQVPKEKPYRDYLLQTFPALESLSQYDRELFFDLILGETRFLSFWRFVAHSIGSKRANRQFIHNISIDKKFLDQYKQDWNARELDEDALTAACPAWPAIRTQIRSTLAQEKADKYIDMDSLSLGLFMLWPDLQQDFQQWSALDEQQRIEATHAVFALSTAAHSYWFIDRALALCPPLANEFDWIVRHRDWNPSPATEADTATSEQAWEALLERLNEIVHELMEQPTQEAVLDLAVLGQELKQASTHLPHRQVDIVQRLNGQTQILMQRLHEIAARDGFAWLDVDLLQRVHARWQIRCDESDDPEHLNTLCAYMTAAVSSLDETVPAYALICQQVDAAADEINRLKQALGSADGFLQKIKIQPQLDAAQQAGLDIEKTQQARQVELIERVLPPDERLERLRDPSPEPDFPPELGKPIEQDVIGTGETDPAQADKAADANVVAQMIHRSVEQSVPIPVSAGMEADPTPPSGEIEPTTVFDINDGTHPAVDAEESLYNRKGGELCKPIWQCLELGKPGLAWHAAHWSMQVHPDVPIPPLALLAAVAYAQDLLESDGPLAIELAAQFERFEKQDFEASTKPDKWHAALNLLLVAATLRPMVLAPASGAVEIAGYLHLGGPDYPALNDLVRQLRTLSRLLAGFRIDANAIKRARGDASIEEELQALQKEARQWYEKARTRKTKYVPASEVWRRWIDQDGYVNVLISPVIGDTRTDTDNVRARLEEMRDSKRVDRQITETDRKDIGRRRGPDIDSDARVQLHALLKEPSRIASQWLELVELLNQGRDNTLRKQLDRIRKLLLESRSAVGVELSAGSDDRWGRIPAARNLVQRAFDDLIALFENPQSVLDDKFEESTPPEVLGRACLTIATLPVANDWQVELTPEQALDCLVSACETPETAEYAYKARLQRGDLLGAQLMLDIGLVDEQASGASLPEHARSRWKEWLKTQIQETRVAVENGRYNGYIPDQAHRSIEEQLARLETGLSDQQRFDLASHEITGINAQVEQWRTARIQEVRSTLQNICADSDEARRYHLRAGRALDAGNLAAAYEIAHWLQEGGEFPDILENHIPNDGFERFFPATQKALSEWLSNTGRDAVGKALRTGAFPASTGLDLSPLDAARQQQSSEMWELWTQMRSKRQATKGQLTRLLRELGLPLRDDDIKQPVPGRRADEPGTWEVKTRPIDDPEICALPTYGSRADGVYRLRCAWNGSVKDILQWIGGPGDDTATLLLYFDRLPEHHWRSLAQMAHKQRRAFVLLDETMLLYLCAIPDARLRAWFNIAMPFSYSSPYDPSAGAVPPEMFYGRSEELEAVYSRDGRCFVYGGRQLGKTALLKRAQQSFNVPASGRLAHWIDLRAEGIGVRRPPIDIWHVLHEWLKGSGLFGASVDTPSRGKKNRPDHEQEVIQAINTFLDADKGNRVLLLLDEADLFFEGDSLDDFTQTRKMKLLMDASERRFKVVFAGLHNVLRMTKYPNHPLAHFGEPIEIGPLHKDKEVADAVALVRRPMAAAGFQFDSIMLVVQILAQTNYYPSLIQLYCSHLIKHMLGRMKNQSLPGPRYLIGADDIKKVYLSDALRNEIRAKFRLTLQLDPRYEVLAYTLALAMLDGECSDQNGIVWQDIRRLANRWWAEGFQDTSEKDFEVLLQEMEGLGVLRRLPEGGYVLRNPNVQLLLGTREEIETVLLDTERTPAVEFDSVSFHPLLRTAPEGESQCNLFTYQQLGELLRFKSHSITLLTGTAAAGVERIEAHLRDYLADGRCHLLTLGMCSDCPSFDRALKAEFDKRSQPLLVLIPHTMPWTAQWLDGARERLKRLGSDNPVSLLFAAEPATLWRWLKDEPVRQNDALPWMSLQHWNEGFVDHWLGDRGFEPELRKRLIRATGLWPERIIELVDNCHTGKELTERLNVGERDWPTPEQALDWQEKFALHLMTDERPDRVLRLLADADAMSMQELEEWAQAEWVDELLMTSDELSSYLVRSLKWGELLGLVRCEGEHLWKLDEIVGKVLKALMREE